MEANIRKYVDGLFADAPPTKKAVELKEEMIQNLTEKYSDLIGGGKAPEAAYNIVIAGIGDISGLLDDLQADTMSPTAINAYRKKSAMVTAIAVMLYICSIIPLILFIYVFRFSSAPIAGIVTMLVFVACATGLLVYNNMSKPRYIKEDDTVVEEFRQWQSETRDQKTMRSSISSAFWSLIVALYFIISFVTGAWHLSWVIFIIGGAVQSIINLAFAAKK